MLLHANIPWTEQVMSKTDTLLWALKSHLKDFHLLQDKLLRLQVVSRQDDDLLYCPFVCGPQQSPVSLHPLSLSCHPSISFFHQET